MSQYYSKHHIITNVQRLVKCNNFKHTAPPRTNITLNDKNIGIVRIT